MKKLAVIIALLFAVCFSGGCAVVPALVTTGASFAVPQAASVAISAASTVHKTALIAADERDMDDMVSDKMTTIRAQAALLSEPGVDVDAQCLNGDLYVVGEYATPEDRDDLVASLQQIEGVQSVKGVLKPMPDSLVALVEPTISDKHAETVIEAGLLKELNFKSANVDVEVVQGEAVIMGVVEDDAEARSVVALVERLRPHTSHPVKVTSLLAAQDVFEQGGRQANDDFVLLTDRQMLALEASPAVGAHPYPGIDFDTVQSAVITPERLPETVTVAQAEEAVPVSVERAADRLPVKRTAWQRARLRMKHRILELAKQEQNPQVKRRLITLSTRVLKDRNTSIEARLVKTLHRTPNLRIKTLVNDILAEYAPDSVVPIQTVAMY